MNFIVLIVITLFYIIVLIPEYVKEGRKYKISNVLKRKLTLSIVFCLVGLKGVFIQSFSFYSILIFIGLLFSLAGDYFLFFIDKNEVKFIFGICMFALTHILYILSMTLLINYTVWEFIITLIICVVVFYIVKSLMKINLGNAEIPLLVYTFLLVLMTIKSVFVIYLSSNYILSKLLFSLGAILFLISDSLLCIDHFALKKPILKNIRDIPYFIGQIMIASSIYFI
jgi:uncharacterized membrane protein YhhN